MADDFGKRTLGLVRTGVGYESITEMDMNPDPIEIAFSSSERNVQRIQNSVAGLLGLQPDDVNVFVEQDENMLITGGTIFLSARDLFRLAEMGGVRFSGEAER